MTGRPEPGQNFPSIPAKDEFSMTRRPGLGENFHKFPAKYDKIYQTELPELVKTKKTFWQKLSME